MQILSTLPAISLSGNLQDLILSAGTAESVTVRLVTAGQVIIEEIYRTDPAGQIKISYGHVIDGVLKVQIPAFQDAVFKQSLGCLDFSILLSSTTGQTDKVDFRVIKGKVDSSELNTVIFLNTSFLTWQPQAKYVQYYDPQWLTYYAAAECELRVQAFCSPSGAVITKKIATLPAGQMSTINLSHGIVQALFAVEGIPLYYDVFVQKDNTRLTYVQRYILSSEEFAFNDVFVFQNSLGGLDTIRFTGQRTDKPNFQFDNARFGELDIDYDLESLHSEEKNTGFFRTVEEKVWSLDFFGSLDKYKVHQGNTLRIHTTELDLASIDGELNDFTFSYSYSQKEDSMNLSRTFEAPPALEFPGESAGEILQLSPRINHYPWAASTDVILPVQYPYEPVWRKLSLRQVIASIVIGTSDPEQPGNTVNGIFGVWSDLATKHGAIITEDLSLQYKTDCSAFPDQIITYLEGQFFLSPSFIGTQIILGIIPEGNRPAKKLFRYFITTNIEMFLTVDTNGEVGIISKDGKNLPTGSANADKYSLSYFFKPGKAVQVRYNPKWIIDETASFCEVSATVYVWGKIFEENVVEFGNGTASADIFLKTFKGTTAPPADLSEPYDCTANLQVSYTMLDPQYPSTRTYGVSMNNQKVIRLAAPGTDKYNPAYPKQAIRVADTGGGISAAWYSFAGAAKDTWRLLQVKGSPGFTGYLISPKLLKVSDDENAFPLDVNNDVCIISGLPQATMDNSTNAPSYRVQNLSSCPV